MSKFKYVVRPARAPSAPFLFSLAVLLALLHAVLAVTATVGTSVTHDEIAHLTAGRTYNVLDDFRLQPENGNLPQRWAALPMAALSPHLPPLNGDAWWCADTWRFSHEFFYELGNDTDLMIFAGRAMISLFSAGTALLVFGWARWLFGLRGAFVSLVLFVFSPNFLAHGALATSDVTMVFFFLAAMTTWWWQLDRPAWRRVLLSGLVFGLACVAKYSAVLLLPMMLLAALFKLATRRPTTRLRFAGWIAGTLAAHGALALLVIWTFYGFRYAAVAPGLVASAIEFYRPWEWFEPRAGWSGVVVNFLRQWHLLPEAFLYGFTFVRDYAQQRGAFLSGHYSLYGWVSFFPVAFLIKTPLPCLILLAGAIVAWGRGLARCGAGWRARFGAQIETAAPLLVLAAVYGAFSLASHLNIGHRHILPIYPVLFILLGSLGAWLDPRRPLALGFLSAMLAWQAGESLWIRPHYLAYFNQIVGGPANGWRHLVDSSLDWGQDLPALARWLQLHNSGPDRAPVYLSYFGTGDPAYEGITATRLPCLPELPPKQPWYRLGPGLYCVSATMLQQVYSTQRGPWTLAAERDFRKLREIEDVLLEYQARQKDRPPNADADATMETAWKRYDTLRFARLCHYLRARQPDAVVNDTIFLYRLSARELAAATGGTLRDFTNAIEQAMLQPPAH
ncbi:MAG TPA: glycosyltransferase family 39 protein [Opitutus sp.]|nr:glycosyltransferase family 39 protein [Opitutus sp.]